jgi:hypothetical protein
MLHCKDHTLPNVWSVWTRVCHTYECILRNAVYFVTILAGRPNQDKHFKTSPQCSKFIIGKCKLACRIYILILFYFFSNTNLLFSFVIVCFRHGRRHYNYAVRIRCLNWETHRNARRQRPFLRQNWRWDSLSLSLSLLHAHKTHAHTHTDTKK